MGTIISHGSGKWGRGDKNKKVDKEMEAEAKKLEAFKTVTKKEIQNADLVKQMSETTDIGDTVIQKVEGETKTLAQRTTHNQNVISHNINGRVYKNGESEKSIVRESTVDAGAVKNKVMEDLKKRMEKIKTGEVEAEKEEQKAQEQKKPTVKHAPPPVAPKFFETDEEEPKEVKKKPTSSKKKGAKSAVSFIEDIDGWEDMLAMLNNDGDTSVPTIEEIQQQSPPPVKRKLMLRDKTPKTPPVDDSLIVSVEPTVKEEPVEEVKETPKPKRKRTYRKKKTQE